ncbi:MAG: CvpA family protein [Verrucomicrobiae bacterium]|nr:CvpA family protein [Verrucomicrobiae bacterium]
MPSSLPFGWYDVLAVIMVVIGVLRGRRRGMSQELLDFFMWLGMVGGGAYVCRQAAPYLIKWTGLSQLSAHLLGYLGTVVAVWFIFMLLKNALRDKLAGSDFFGRLEYPLGILAAIIRFLCILVLLAALVNAKFQTEEQKQQARKDQEKELGSSFFPTLGDIQDGIFKKSFCGSQLAKHAPYLLIPPSKTEGEDLRTKEGLGRQRERELDKILGK